MNNPEAIRYSYDLPLEMCDDKLVELAKKDHRSISVASGSVAFNRCLNFCPTLSIVSVRTVVIVVHSAKLRVESTSYYS